MYVSGSTLPAQFIPSDCQLETAASYPAGVTGRRPPLVSLQPGRASIVLNLISSLVFIMTTTAARTFTSRIRSQESEDRGLGCSLAKLCTIGVMPHINPIQLMEYDIEDNDALQVKRMVDREVSKGINTASCQ